MLDRLESVSRWTALAVAILGIVVLLGWASGSQTLQRFSPTLPATTPNTAALFVLAGVAVAAMTMRFPRTPTVTRLCGSLILLTGLLTVAEYAWHIDFGIDRLLLDLLQAAQPDNPHPGRMSLAAAVAFSLLGGALQLPDAPRLTWLSQTLALGPLLVGLQVGIGVIYGAQSFYRLMPFATIGVLTLTGFILIGLALLLAHPQRGITALLIDSGPGGALARLMVPVALFVPLGFGWLRWQAQLQGWVDTQSGLALYTFSNMALIGAAALLLAGRLRQVDRGRLRADAALRDSEARLQILIAHAPAALAMFDRDMRYIAVSQRWRDDYRLGDREIIGLSHYEIFPEIPEGWKEAHRRGLAGEVLRAEADRFERADGVVQWVRWEIRPWHEDSGPVDGIVIFSEDITERMEAQEALRRSRELLSLITDRVPALISYIDAGYRYQLANRGYQRWFGMAPEEIVGRTVPEILGEAAWDKVYSWMARALAGEAVSYELELPYREGGPRWVHVSYTPDEDERGQVRGFVVLVIDISQRKLAEEALQKSENHFRALVQASSDVVYRMSADWQEMRHLTGRQFIADTDEPRRSWLEKYIPPVEQARVMSAIHEAIRTKSVFELEHQVFRVDGSVGWTFSRAVPMLDANGEIIDWFGMASDVTARKEAEEALRRSEQRLRRFYDSGLIGVIYWTMDGRITDANDKFLQLVGYSREELESGLIDWASMTPPEWLPLDERSVAELLATGMNKQPFEKEYFRKDGTRLPILVAGAMLDEQRYEGVAFILDISERKRAEQELRQWKDELEVRVEQRTAELKAANADLESYAYAVSHDLRAPLRAISGFTQIITSNYSDRLDAIGHQYLEHVIDGTRRMGELIDGLLQLSRSARGEFMRRQVDLSAMTHRILAENATNDPGRTVRCEIEDDLEAQGDPRMLEVLMSNLLDNAWKYTAKTPQATIRVFREGDQFCIADNGAGFDPSQATKLFQPFQRLHSQSEFPGLGIGLATVQRIIRRHGGQISATAIPGQGATFRFSL